MYLRQVRLSGSEALLRDGRERACQRSDIGLAGAVQSASACRVSHGILEAR